MKLFKILILLILLFFGVTFFVKNIESVEMTPKEVKKWALQVLEEDKKKYFLDMIIGGNIVDGKGQALNNVTVIVEETYAGNKKGERKSMDGSSSWTKKKFQLDEKFEFNFKGVMSVELTFLKDGYYYEVFSYASSNPIRRDMDFKNGSYYFINEQVVLKKKGKLTKLNRYEVRFQIDSNSSFDVWNLKEITPTNNFSQQPVKLKIKSLIEINYPAIYARIYNKNEPAIFNKNIKIFPKNKYIELILNDEKNGGLISVNPKGRSNREIERSMIQAPKKGYGTSMKIFKNIFNMGGSMYFYFKLKGFYGKGQIYSANYQNEEKFVFSIIFLLQPDGSRNIETKNFY